MAESTYNYQVGGSLPVNAPTYVTRSADQEFYQGCNWIDAYLNTHPEETELIEFCQTGKRQT